MRLVAASIVLVLAFAAFAVWRLGYWLSSPAGTPVKADLIVALGGDPGDRVVLAVKLNKSGYAKRILLTGMEGGADATRMHYLNWRSRYLRDADVPETAILFDGLSANTHEEALNTARLMSRKGWNRVLIVSDPPHMRRLDMTFGPVFANAGLSYTLIETHSPTWDAQHWWRDEKWGQFSVMEAIKLLYYAVKY
jgi:uncharacterized SAM-binding protein YcdF (DUF218 family)